MKRSPCKLLLLRALALVATFASGVGTAPAQGGDAIPATTPVTFRQLASAPFQVSHISDRTRTFLDSAGQLVQVQEQLTLQASGDDSSPFKLDFVDLVGSGVPDSVARSRWDDVYRNNAGLLHMHSGFRVTDAQFAQQNYQIFDFGSTLRLGRAARRVVVFPLRTDKSIWLLDLDQASGVTLYSAEFDTQLRLISEIETTSFTVIGPVVASSAGSSGSSAWSWQPRMSVTRVDTFDDALAIYDARAPKQPKIEKFVTEYRQHLIQVTEDPVNGDKTLVLGYTDGVDEFFVLQSDTGSNPFASSVAIASPTSSAAHAIACYDDPAMRAYVFHDAGTTYWVVGSGALVRLRDVALRFCQQAVSSR